jgi:hypothetical protein
MGTAEATTLRTSLGFGTQVYSAAFDFTDFGFDDLSRYALAVSQQLCQSDDEDRQALDLLLQILDSITLFSDIVPSFRGRVLSLIYAALLEPMP